MRPVRFIGWMPGLVAAVVLGVMSTAVAAPSASGMVGTVRVELSIDKAIYTVGEPIAVTLTLTNVGNEPATFQFNTGQIYDFVVARSGVIVWRWSQGKAFTQALTVLTLRPGEARRFQEQWNQRDAQGRQVQSGSYELVAAFPAPGGPGAPVVPEGPRARFRISSVTGGASRRLPVVTSREAVTSGRVVGEVLINGTPVLRFRIAAGGFTPGRRAEIVASRIRDMLTRGLRPAELTVVSISGEAAVVWRRELLVTADAAHARLNWASPIALATQWTKALVAELSSGQ